MTLPDIYDAVEEVLGCGYSAPVQGARSTSDESNFLKVFTYVARTNTLYSVNKIANFLGVNHSTISVACKSVSVNLRLYDDAIREVKQILKGGKTDFITELKDLLRKHKVKW